MENLEWIKDLARDEQKMEETGMVDFGTTLEPQRQLKLLTVDFLRNLKEDFVDYATVFNKLRGTTYNSIKIYGISNTEADFMLFRNGYKLIFTMKEPGALAIRLYIQPPSLVISKDEGEPGTQEAQRAQIDTIQASWGPFGELHWIYNGAKVNEKQLVKFYMQRFVRESAK